MERNFTPIQLPSRCLPYEGIDPSKIEIATLTGEDELFISDLVSKNLDTKFALLCDKTLVGIDCRKLTLGDRLFLLVWQCIHSYSNFVEEQVICPYCNKQFTQQINLSNIDIKFLDSLDNVGVELSDKTTVKLRLLTVKDKLDINEFEANGSNPWLYTWAKTIVNSKSIVENIEFLNNLSAADNAKIRGWHKKHFHGPEMKSKIECPQCKEESVVDVPFRIEWLLRSI